MLKPVFLQTGFRLLKTGFKPVFGFTNLHKNIKLYKAKAVSTLIWSSSRFSLKEAMNTHSFVFYR